jgi:hypothetical protein
MVKIITVRGYRMGKAHKPPQTVKPHRVRSYKRRVPR